MFIHIGRVEGCLLLDKILVHEYNIPRSKTGEVLCAPQSPKKQELMLLATRCCGPRHCLIS